MHIGDILERHLDDAVAVAGGRRNGNAPDRSQALAIGGREAHHHRKVTIAGAFV
jgi:hypothetical protein